MSEAHVRTMVQCFKILLMFVAAAALAACASSGIPQDGRYQTHGTGWDNWRG